MNFSPERNEKHTIKLCVLIIEMCRYDLKFRERRCLAQRRPTPLHCNRQYVVVRACLSLNDLSLSGEWNDWCNIKYWTLSTLFNRKLLIIIYHWEQDRFVFSSFTRTYYFVYRFFGILKYQKVSNETCIIRCAKRSYQRTHFSPLQKQLYRTFV